MLGVTGLNRNKLAFARGNRFEQAVFAFLPFLGVIGLKRNKLFFAWGNRVEQEQAGLC